MNYQNPIKPIPEQSKTTKVKQIIIGTAIVGVTSVVAYSLVCSKLGYHMCRPVRIEQTPEGAIRLVSQTITRGKWYANLIQKK